MLRFIPFAIILVATLSIVTSCNRFERIDTYPTLANKGMLPLSTTNAYQGANLFLARELERSSYLFQFFKTKGAPTAIEIRERDFLTPQLYLYYISEKSAYIAELQAQKRSRQWIVRGPYGINREDFRTLQRVSQAISGAPVFELHNQPYRFTSQQEIKIARKLEPEIPFIPPPTPVPTPAPTPIPLNASGLDVPKEPEKPIYEDLDFIPQNLDQQALMLAAGYAKKDTETGDILHTVELSSETITAITAWYTGDAQNLAEVLKANKLMHETPLNPGEVVRVPYTLIKRVKKMPLDAFKKDRADIPESQFPQGISQ
ncbi:MAG: hypothetical protein KDD55_00085 [Bdellovibrionales bacterium]|nr:hypothetical protein [Bdellovibrionales bacterium]